MAHEMNSLFLHLPAELRLQIYRILFQGLEFLHDKEPKYHLWPATRRELEPLQNKAVKAQSSILRVCRTTRKEASDEFNNIVWVRVPNWWSLPDSLPRLLRNVRQLEVFYSDMTIEDVLSDLPQVQKVVINLDEHVTPFAMNANNLPALLCGVFDEAIIRYYILEYRDTDGVTVYRPPLREAIAELKSMIEFHRQGPVKLEFSYIFKCRFVHKATEGCRHWKVLSDDLYRLTIDSQTKRLTKREINVRHESDGNPNWVPAEQVFGIPVRVNEWLLTVLYVPHSREMRILIWQRDTKDRQVHSISEMSGICQSIRRELGNEVRLRDYMKTAGRCAVSRRPEKGIPSRSRDMNVVRRIEANASRKDSEA